LRGGSADEHIGLLHLLRLGVEDTDHAETTSPTSLFTSETVEPLGELAAEQQTGAVRRFE
jgi:hypothetical protein